MVSFDFFDSSFPHHLLARVVDILSLFLNAQQAHLYRSLQVSPFFSTSLSICTSPCAVGDLHQQTHQFLLQIAFHESLDVVELRSVIPLIVFFYLNCIQN